MVTRDFSLEKVSPEKYFNKILTRRERDLWADDITAELGKMVAPITVSKIFL